MKVNQAKLAIKNENFELAISLLSEVISLDVETNNENFEHYALRAVALRKIKSFDLSVADFSEAIRINPTDPDLRTEKGVSLFHQKNIKLALVEMDKAVELDPENPYRYASRAYIKDALKDIEGAINDYREAIKLDPKDAIAHNNLGMLEEKKGNLDKAKKHFNESDDLQGVDMKQITDDAVKNGGSSLKMDGARKEVLKIQGNKQVTITEKKLTVWTVITKVFTDKKIRREFIDYIKVLFQPKK
jgi:Flp pilus assembly protein TadD